MTCDFPKISFNPGREDNFLELSLPVKHMQRYDKLRLISSLRTDELAFRLGSNKSAVGQGETVDLTESQALSQHCGRARRQNTRKEAHGVGAGQDITPVIKRTMFNIFRPAVRIVSNIS